MRGTGDDVEWPRPEDGRPVERGDTGGGRPRSVHEPRPGSDHADGVIRETTDEPSVAVGVGDGGPAFADAGIGMYVRGPHATQEMAGAFESIRGAVSPTSD